MVIGQLQHACQNDGSIILTMLHDLPIWRRADEKEITLYFKRTSNLESHVYVFHLKLGVCSRFTEPS